MPGRRTFNRPEMKARANNNDAVASYLQRKPDRRAAKATVLLELEKPPNGSSGAKALRS